MIRTEMLRAFVTVAKAGGLVEGASALSRTPSAVSMTLQRLEQHLGHRLFEPGRKNRPTALGEAVLELAERELRHHARTVEAIEGLAAGRIGEVRIAAVPSYASHRLPVIAAAFLEAHPRVRLDVHDLDSAGVLHELFAERVDVGIASDPPHDARLHRVVLESDRFGLVVRRDHALAARRALAWPTLEGERLLANALSERIDAAHGHRIPATTSLRVHTTGTLLAMVRAGLGATILPELVSHDVGPDLRFVPLERPVIRRELCLLSRANETPGPATNLFLQFVGETSRRA